MDCSTPGFPLHHQLLEVCQSNVLTSVMPSNYLIFCHPLLLPPSVIPSIRVSSKLSVLCIKWPKYWSFSFNINPSNEYLGLISFRMDSPCSPRDVQESSPTLQSNSISSSALNFLWEDSFCKNAVS